MKWIKKEDTVLVITGNDKGKKGSVLLKKGDKIIVQGVNVRKKLIRKKDAAQSVYVEMPIHISNVALCNKEGKKIKIKRKKDQLVYIDEKGEEVVHRELKKKGKKSKKGKK